MDADELDADALATKASVRIFAVCILAAAIGVASSLAEAAINATSFPLSHLQDDRELVRLGDIIIRDEFPLQWLDVEVAGVEHGENDVVGRNRPLVAVVLVVFEVSRRLRWDGWFARV